MLYHCYKFLVLDSLQARAGVEEQMSKNSPGEDRGPSMASRDNSQNQCETSTATIENQVREHSLFYGVCGFPLGNEGLVILKGEICCC